MMERTKQKTQKKPNKPFRIWIGEITDPNFPRYANKKTPQLLFQVSRKDPEEHITALNNGSAPKSEFTQKFGLTPRMDILDSLPEDLCAQNTFKNRKDWKPVRKKIKEHLQKNDYVVDLNHGLTTYTIYVVNLQGEKTDGTRPKKWVYVGETSKSATERLEEHKQGIRSNKYVQQYGVDLNRNLMCDIPKAHFKSDSLYLEKTTAELLRKQGYVVEGGQGEDLTTTIV
tara:strand:- start:413 stop:1096 length:684 start_codon:yes stop_codon:yes gene_type:complete